MVKVRPIEPGDAGQVQRLMVSNADYSRRVTGTVPAPNAADELLTALPPGALNSQKVTLGLWNGPLLVAFVDLVVGWPVDNVAHIGLLMTDGARQRQGFARRIHDAVIDEVAQWPNVHMLRLSIVDTNASLVESFWTELGYRPTGEAVPYVYANVQSMARIWARPVTPM